MTSTQLSEPLQTAITFEKIPTHLYRDAQTASEAVARQIADLIRHKQTRGQPCVLGLATGSSPKSVYAELVRLHLNEGLSFQNVFSFNLDEYYPMTAESAQSYHRFMKNHLFDPVDMPPQNVFIPDGTIPAHQLADYCRGYDQKIEALGGIDCQLLGIGGNGHIGFNEPGSLINSATRLMMLDHTTRVATAQEFGGLAHTPRKAITLGVSSILKAKQIILLAWGEAKAPIIRMAVEGPVSENIPASYLQTHPNTLVVIDQAAASELTRIKTPWLVDSVEWTVQMKKKAVTHLSRLLDKPILKLTDRDYNDHGMSDLLACYGSAYDINLDVFYRIQRTITGWPGGKPAADDTHRPERSTPVSKRCLIFSPHPDDDIISMGGTFQRLVDQGHDVHVGYQTSGNIAVADDETRRFVDFVTDFNVHFELQHPMGEHFLEVSRVFLAQKKRGEMDCAAVRKLKGLIRQGEAKATCRFVGVPAENVHFLNLPFYETGKVQKKPLRDADITLTMQLIEQIKPHQIYAAGDLADPHGTHKVCLDAVFEALRRLKAGAVGSDHYLNDCWVWLYRGAWAEWPVDEIEMAVPMSPDQVIRKRLGIFKHQSQKDGVVFQGTDSREFWQRAEERNQATAQLYNRLGLAEYEAMEAFVRYHF